MTAPPLVLVFPHQLFEPHPALLPGLPVALIEDSLFFGGDPHWPLRPHRQKLALHRASLKAYAGRLARRGHQVVYREHQPGLPTGAHLEALSGLGYREFRVADPVDDLLLRRLHRHGARSGVRLTVLDSPQFLSPPAFLAEQLPPGRKPLMARFYEAQRRRLGVLLDARGAPLGGRWSFDGENRKRLPAGAAVPPEPAAPPTGEARAALDWVRRNRGENPGGLDGFSYPTTHEAAAAWLDRFLEERLPRFGTYEDALSARHRVLFHGVLTPMLNIGLLTPAQVLERTLEHASDRPVPLNSLEGFIRQIIGWREFIRAIYDRQGVPLRNGNFFGHTRRVPPAFYLGTTGLPPVDDVIRRVLAHGWCHHIERLMVLGNLMLLCGFHPTAVYDWFMELFVDAYDWVMVPNVYGMSQFADGGGFTTKPYLSGSNYLRRMSDYPPGAWCDTWDGLFWTFVGDHEAFFRSQPRLSLMAGHLDRMAPRSRLAHRRAAETFLERIGAG